MADVAVSQTDLGCLLANSVRYVLPRGSYAPWQVMKCIEKHIAELLPSDLLIIRHEIERDATHSPYHAREWLAVLTKVRDEIARRNEVKVTEEPAAP